MRVLIMSFALLSLPGLALAQAASQGQPQGGSQGDQKQSGPQRYPGDYCTRHCRHNEIPCGGGCVPKSEKFKEKKTTTCAGKP